MLRKQLIVMATALAAMALVSSFKLLGYTVNAGWASPSAVFYINPLNTRLTAEAVENALLSAMNEWGLHSTSDFRYTYGGRVTDTAVGFDGRNVMLFRNEFNGTTIATTYWWTSASQLVDADIVFWEGGYTFYTGTSGCSGNGVYLEDAATHELGHALGLGHSTVTAATMYPTYSPCSQEARTLAADDKAGALALYGSTLPNTPPVVTIASPSPGGSYTQNIAVSFAGSATDAEDGTLTSAMRWSSNIDGVLGSGGAISHVLSAGAHVITASVTDSRGSTSSATVSMTVLPAPPGSNSAAFAGTDTTTQGKWWTVYGTQGFLIANNGVSQPQFATIARDGGTAYTWTASTTDVRALQMPGIETQYRATAWYGDFDTRVNLTDGLPHRVSLYVLDWDFGGRSETIQILDGTNGAVLDEQLVSSFANGAFLTWTMTGSIVIRLRVQGGDNAVYSGIFFDPAAAPPTVTSAAFVRADVATQGTWKGTYGTTGYALAGDSTNVPAYATVAHNGSQVWTWTPSTSDPRALQRSASSARQASTWYGSSIDVDVRLADGAAHNLSLYFLDWDYNDGRSATVQVLDADTLAPIDTRTVAAFSQGQYLTWTVTGHVIVRIVSTGSGNAVYSGVFLDPATSSPPPPPAATAASFVRFDTTTQGTWKGTYGTAGYALAGDTTSLPGYAAIAHNGSQAWTWTMSTIEPRAPQRGTASGRQASTWYGSTIDVDVRLTDGRSHPISLYFLDWDYNNGRSATIQILDGDTLSVLDTRTIGAFSQGQYLTWTIAGHVIVRITSTGTGNAVYSGVFLD
jgi:hypothetical protein